MTDSGNQAGGDREPAAHRHARNVTRGWLWNPSARLNAATRQLPPATRVDPRSSDGYSLDVAVRRASALPAALCAVSLAMLLGCSAATRFSVNADGSGRVQLHITLDPFLVAWLKGQDDQSPPGQLPDAREIRKELSELPGVTVASVAAVPSGTFDIDLAFADITKIVDKGLEDPPFAFSTSSDGTHTLTMTFTAMSWQSFMRIPALGANDAIAQFSPTPGHGMSEEMYREYVSGWFSADPATRADVASALDRSRIVVTVVVDGSIVSQTGGTIDGTTVTYTLPLVQLGTTGGPLPLSVSFR